MYSGEIRVVNGFRGPASKLTTITRYLARGAQKPLNDTKKYRDQLTHPHRGWLLTDWVDTSPSDPVPLLQNLDGRVGKKGKIERTCVGLNAILKLMNLMWDPTKRVPQESN